MIIGGGEGSSYFEVHSVGAHMQRQVNLSVIQSDVSETQINLELQCHVDRWVNGLELETVGILHGATTLNELIMDNVLTEDVFTIAPSASLLAIPTSHSTIYINEHQLYYTELPSSTSKVLILDQLGRRISMFNISDSSGVVNVNSNYSGTAFVICRDVLGSVLKRQTVFIH